MADWDQGLVKFVIKDCNGKRSVQEQMCWHKGKFIARMVADAMKSQLDSDKAKSFEFCLLQ